MYDPYFLKILMQEREQEIREEVARGRYYARRRRGGSGVLKKIARRLLSVFSRFKTIAGPRQNRQQSNRCKGRA